MSKNTVHSSQVTVHLGDLEKTKTVAKDLAKKSKPGDCYCLIGDLGAGKTEFARAFIRELCGDVTVASPTFNIVLSYEFQGFRVNDLTTPKLRNSETIYHFDLYRLNNASELEEIGLEDALEKAITLIEWPQLAENLLPANRKNIEIKIIDESTREIKIS